LEQSLIVRRGEEIVFTSNEHWLHPLFELEDFLKGKEIPPSELFVIDKIAGKAAACLMVRLGITRCHIGLLSERAIPVFNAHGVDFSYDSLVDQIQCRTEDLITDSMSIGDAYLFLRKRAGRVQGLPVRIENLTVDIGRRNVLENLNLELGRGEQLVIHGANGTGKTTLLRTLLGFIQPVQGTLRVGDIRVGSDEWRHNRSLIGYVHQENVKNTFPISAEEVVAIGMSERKLSSRELNYRVELAMRRTGCFHLARQSYHHLSGGEKQRVSLARCLSQNARVLLFDEPTSFLDSGGKEDLRQLLGELSSTEAPTMILVSHETAWLDQLNWPRKELKGGQLC
jgi:ABC-type Mn2+/Zn2+ transport system ATPase subunit